jgi:hypothetical protein
MTIPVIPAKAGTSARPAPSPFPPEAIEQGQTALGSLQPCPGDMAAYSISAGLT